MKYLYKGQKLVDYFREDKRTYQSVCQYLRKLESELTSIDYDCAITLFLKERDKRMENRKISKAVNDLFEKDSVVNFFDTCSLLGIDYAHIQYLQTRGYDKKLMMIYTWFYFDKVNREGNKILTIKRFHEVSDFSYLDKEVTILDLIISYRLGNHSISTRLIDFEKLYILGTIRRTFSDYSIPISLYYSEYEDIFHDCCIYLLQIVHRVAFNDVKSVVKYISIRLRYYIKDCVEKEYIEKKEISFEDNFCFPENHVASYQSFNPLSLLIQKEEREIVLKVYLQLDKEEQKVIYDLYFKSGSLFSVWDFFTSNIDGSDVHDALGKFQEECLKLFGGTF